MKIGNIDLDLLNDGMFRLDGGTMFRTVPKALWEKYAPADAANRIELRAGVLLIRANGQNILVDAGMGTKLSPKLRRIYSFEESQLLADLKSLGLDARDIDVVVLTHLHLDHAGGSTLLDSSGKPVPQFERATYIVQEKEWQAANEPGELTRGSYIADDFVPLGQKGILKPVSGEYRVADGVTARLVGAHSEGHQIVVIESQGRTAVFPGDIIPTSAHLKPAYVTSFDLFPLEVLKVKKQLVADALKGRHLLVFQHDPRVKMAYISEEDGHVALKPEE